MCTLHLFYRVFPEAPVLFAANRDEILDRPWQDPSILSLSPRVYGPRDSVAGGTWLGVNEAGVLAGLANHEGTLTKSPSPCSRGAVVLGALRCGSAEEARDFAERTAPACKSYTLLLADPKAACVVDRTPGGTRVYPLGPGCHVVTNARFRAASDPKARRSLRRMEELASAAVTPSWTELFRFLADHGADAPSATPLCIHPEGTSRFGTSSASVISIGELGETRAFLFAPGPPCSTPFLDMMPFQGLPADVAGGAEPTAD